MHELDTLGKSGQPLRHYGTGLQASRCGFRATKSESKTTPQPSPPTITLDQRRGLNTSALVYILNGVLVLLRLRNGCRHTR